MITRKKADLLEKLMGQLQSMHAELTALSKKSPNDGVNSFKLGFVNAALDRCNDLLGNDYQPVGGFKAFNLDDVPSNSDVSFVIAQYLEALEKLRSDNVKLDVDWIYDLPNGEHEMPAAPPAKVRKR